MIKLTKTCCRSLIALILLAGWTYGEAAAQQGPGGIQAFLEKVQKAYHNTPYLGFRIKYLYANQSEPGKYRDSLTGEVEMDKNRYRLVLGGSETVVTDKYAIQVMDGQKALYLSAAQRKGIPDPVSMLDSVFVHQKGVRTTMRQEGQSEIAIIDFPPGQTYSRIQIGIDSRTGYFQKISYALNTTGLVSQEELAGPGHAGPYETQGFVDIVFSDYEQGRFGDSLFNSANFFNKTAGGFVPAGRFKEYQLFLASSNL